MNIQHTLIAAAVLAIGFAAAVPALADTDTTVTVTRTHEHHYVYYGDHQIYFAPDTKTYYWETDGAWKSGAELPSERRAYVTAGGVNIDLNTDQPYERNAWVVKHYRDKHDGDALRDDGDDKDGGDKR
jgi:hypothetical protein